MKPSIYFASKIKYAPVWQEFRNEHYDHIEVVSSWIDLKIGPMEDNDPSMCKQGWIQNIQDVSNCNYLMCYAEFDDELSGTLVEIGAALATGKRIVLCGRNERWKTWQHHPFIIYQTGMIEIGLLRILADWKHWEVRKDEARSSY